jgi:hypothetical protein
VSYFPASGVYFLGIVTGVGLCVIAAELGYGDLGRMPTTTIRLHSGETVTCPHGIVWTPATGGKILCRVSRKDGGYVFRGIALSDIDVLDAR